MSSDTKMMTPLNFAARKFWKIVRRVFFISFFLNMLVLVTPIYMMTVFDRVVQTGSTDTLIFLTIFAIFALMIYGVLETLRGRILTVFSAWLDDKLSDHLISTSIRAGLMGRPVGAQPLRELSNIRGFVGSNMITALCDAVWIPLFIAAIFLLHGILGWVAVGGGIILFTLAYVNDVWTRNPTREAAQLSAKAQASADAALRNGEVVQAMGLLPGLLHRWRAGNRTALKQHILTGERSATILGSGKFFRMFVQIGILGLGAHLVTQGEITAGAMIAASILLGRALAPVEQALGGWRGLSGALDSRRRLEALMRALPDPEEGMTLPAPKGELSVEKLTFVPRGSGKPILRNISMDAHPGEAIGVVGPSASGKSTLCRMIVGLHPPTQGHARLDGAETYHWQRSDFGRYVGYMPQDVEIFPGTVWENIARLDPDADPSDIVSAAKLAGVESMIRALPQGYDTQIGEGGLPLSGGQKQRIALARAVYGKPRLLVLDEPNASLDKEGELALENTVAAMKAMGAAVIMVAHKPNVLMQTERVLVLREGMVEMFDDRDTVLARIAGPRFLEAARQEVAAEFMAPPQQGIQPPPPQSQPQMRTQAQPEQSKPADPQKAAEALKKAHGNVKARMETEAQENEQDAPATAENEAPYKKPYVIKRGAAQKAESQEQKDDTAKEEDVKISATISYDVAEDNKGTPKVTREREAAVAGKPAQQSAADPLDLLFADDEDEE